MNTRQSSGSAHKEIAELRRQLAEAQQAREQATEYARTFCVSLAKKYPAIPEWEPLPDLLGLLMQIDNMAAGLISQRDTARDWIKCANSFAWAHERSCPRHDADAACNCGLDQFLSRPKPTVEQWKGERDTYARLLRRAQEEMRLLHMKDLATVYDVTLRHEIATALGGVSEPASGVPSAEWIDQNSVQCDACHHEFVDLTAIKEGGKQHAIAGDSEGQGTGCAFCMDADAELHAKEPASLTYSIKDLGLQLAEAQQARERLQADFEATLLDRNELLAHYQTRTRERDTYARLLRELYKLVKHLYPNALTFSHEERITSALAGVSEPASERIRGGE